MKYQTTPNLGAIGVIGGTAATPKPRQPKSYMHMMFPSILATCLGAAATGALVDRAPVEIRVNDKVIVFALVGENKKKPASLLPQIGPSPGPWVDDMLWIKQSAGITMSALADIMGVTRKTLYDWIG